MDENDIKVLRQRKADLTDEASALFAKAKEEGNRALTEDEKKRDDEIQVELDQVNADLGRATRHLERQREMETIADPNRQIDEAAREIAGGGEPGLCGFRDIIEFAVAVQRGTPGTGAFRIDERLAAMVQAGGVQAAPTNFHQEGGAAEGYMVPPAFRDEIWQLVFDAGDVMSRITFEPTMGNQVSLLADETTPWGATGIQANWRAEGAQMNATKAVTNARQVILNELYAFVLATEELLEDAPRLANRLTRKAAEAINFKASSAIVYGTGAGQPLGWFESGALISVAKESSQLADTVVTANVAKMFSRMLPRGLARTFWLVNSDILPQLMVMVISNQPVWTAPGSGLREAPGGLLMGRPLLLSEHGKTLGDKGDIQFIDPAGYYAVNKAQGIKFDTSIHLYFDYNLQAFRWTFRLGGQPFLSAAVSPKYGSNTKSHFVTLDERA